MNHRDKTVVASTALQRADAVCDQRSAERYFRTFVIANDSEMLDQVYRLRYEVLCSERDLLPAAIYPAQREKDEFDDRATHVVTMNNRGKLVACARIVAGDIDCLPIAFWCSLFPHFQEKAGAIKTMAEVSRVVFAPEVRARSGDGFAGDCTVSGAIGNPTRGLNHVAMSLYMGIVRAATSMALTHLMCSMEKACHLALYTHRIPFRTVGHVSDYIGTVTPYVLSLDELNQVLTARHPHIWKKYVLLQRPGLAEAAEAAEMPSCV